jgi:hypothetical protein
MSYNCSAAFSISVDGIDLIDALHDLRKPDISDTEFFLYRGFLDPYKEIRQGLINKTIPCNIKPKNSKFFDDIAFIADMTSGGFFAKSNGATIGKEGYSGEFNINPYVFDSENYIEDPFVILEILIFSYFYSKALNKSKISLNIGDAGLFYMDLDLINGEIESIACTYPEDTEGDDESGHGFECTESEMKEFFENLKKGNL